MLDYDNQYVASNIPHIRGSHCMYIGSHDVRHIALRYFVHVTDKLWKHAYIIICVRTL